MSNVVADYSSDYLTMENYYIYGNGLAYRVDRNDKVYCYHYSYTGHTIAITDENENVVNRYNYTPFGEIIGSQETIPNDFKYAGRFGVMDDGNGLLYMRNRYYDVKLGRFITKDPIGFNGGNNLYRYVSNNPINRIDPLGLCDMAGDAGISGDLGVSGDNITSNKTLGLSDPYNTPFSFPPGTPGYSDKWTNPSNGRWEYQPWDDTGMWHALNFYSEFIPGKVGTAVGSAKKAYEIYRYISNDD